MKRGSRGGLAHASLAAKTLLVTWLLFAPGFSAAEEPPKAHGGVLSHLIPWGSVLAPTPVGPVPLFVTSSAKRIETTARTHAETHVDAVNAVANAVAATTEQAAAEQAGTVMPAEAATVMPAEAAVVPAAAAPETAAIVPATAASAGGDEGTQTLLVDTPEVPPVVYDSGGRRDPFRSLLLMATYDPALLEVNGALLVGIAEGEDQRLAMVEDTQGGVFALRVGDRVRNGRVAYIEESRAGFDLWAYGRSERRVLTFKPKESE